MPLTAGLRFTNPAIDLGDPLTDLGRPDSFVNLLLNPDFEDGLTSWDVNPEAVIRSGNPEPFEGNNYFVAGATASGFASQFVNLADRGYTAEQIDSGAFDLLFGGRVRSFDQVPEDRGQIAIRFYDQNDALITFINPVGESVDEYLSEVGDERKYWELLGDQISIPVGTRSIQYEFTATRASGTNNDAYLDEAFVSLVHQSVALDTGAYGNIADDVAVSSAPARIALRFPDLYTDWEIARPQTIAWETYGNLDNSSVRIDLYQDGANGPELLLTISDATPDDGEYIWIPENDGIDFGTYGLRIQVSLADNASVFDRSTETFNTPEDGDLTTSTITPMKTTSTLWEQLAAIVTLARVPAHRSRIRSICSVFTICRLEI